MLLYEAKMLGCLDAARVIDITKETDLYSHERRYVANLLAIASGKQRLSHMNELVEDEFKVACGGDYPKRSSNHDYLDRIAARDAELVQNGQESIVEKFMDETTRGYIQAGVLDGENVYVDKHVIEVCTEKNIPKDQHGTKRTIVKAIDEIRAVCADTKTSIFSKFLNAGESMVKMVEPALMKIKSLTDKTVKLLGLDKGFYDYAELKKAAEENGACIAIWGKDIPKTLESLAAVPKEKFEPYEVEVVKGSNGSTCEVLKVQIADAGEIVVDGEGDKVRAVVLQNEETGRRVGILTFGKTAGAYDKREIADFLYGKQHVENYFKERKKWGSDKFCGGLFKEVKILPPSKEEIQKMQKRITGIEKKLPKLSQDIEDYASLLKEKKLSKSDYKKLSKKAHSDIVRLEEQLKGLKVKVELGVKGLTPQQEPQHELDTRKMAILSVIQDHALMCRRYILTSVKQLLKEVLLEKLGHSLSLTEHALEEKVVRHLSNINMQTLSTRLFEQGGYIYKDDSANEYVVIMKNYDISFLQEVYLKLCKEFQKIDVYIESGKKKYRLVFTNENSFKKKYGRNLSVKVRAA